METCITFGCNNPRDHNRRICNQCRNRQRGEAAKRTRASQPKRDRKRPKQTYGPCTPACPGWRECTDQRLWAKAEPLPCEGLLDDEIGMDYEQDDSLPYWVMPLEVKVTIDVEG